MEKQNKKRLAELQINFPQINLPRNFPQTTKLISTKYTAQ